MAIRNDDHERRIACYVCKRVRFYFNHVILSTPPTQRAIEAERFLSRLMNEVNDAPELFIVYSIIYDHPNLAPRVQRNLTRRCVKLGIPAKIVGCDQFRSYYFRCDCAHHKAKDVIGDIMKDEAHAWKILKLWIRAGFQPIAENLLCLNSEKVLRILRMCGLGSTAQLPSLAWRTSLLRKEYCWGDGDVLRAMVAAGWDAGVTLPLRCLLHSKVLETQFMDRFHYRPSACDLRMAIKSDNLRVVELALRLHLSHKIEHRSTSFDIQKALAVQDYRLVELALRVMHLANRPWDMEWHRYSCDILKAFRETQNPILLELLAVYVRPIGNWVYIYHSLLTTFRNPSVARDMIESKIYQLTGKRYDQLISQLQEIVLDPPKPQPELLETPMITSLAI